MFRKKKEPSIWKMEDTFCSLFSNATALNMYVF